MSKKGHEMSDDKGIAPITVSPRCWMYPEPSGLAVVIETLDTGGNVIAIGQAVIPWRKLDEARRIAAKQKK